MHRDIIEGGMVAHRKIIEFTGDGKSNKTAILFKKARSENEHIKMQYRYMREQKTFSKSQTLIEVDDDNYIYDIHETPQGKLWFKIPRALYGEEVRKKMRSKQIDIFKAFDKFKLDTCKCGHKREDHKRIPAAEGFIVSDVMWNGGPCKKCKCKKFGYAKSWASMYKEVKKADLND